MITDPVSECRQRANSYKILAECYHPPDDSLLQALNDIGEAAEGFLPEIVRKAPVADSLERHNVDYSRLFLGPFKLLAPPYGSVYLEDGTLMGGSTLEAKDLYCREGLDVILKDAPDHISVELEFMYFLVLKEAEARENSDFKQVEHFQNKQAFFLRAHLGRWVEAFTDNIETNAQTEFYKALGRATKNFVLEDLGGLLEDCECTTMES